MAARLVGDFVVRKDLYVVKACDHPALTLDAALGLLNSSFYSYSYLSRSASATKSDFRQVTMAGLRALPLIEDAEVLREVAARARAIERAIAHGEPWDSLDQEIDRIIFDGFGIPRSERDTISEFLSRRG